MGGTGVCVEQRNSCGQDAACVGSDPPIAPPMRRGWGVSLALLRALHRASSQCAHINEYL